MLIRLLFILKFIKLFFVSFFMNAQHMNACIRITHIDLHIQCGIKVFTVWFRHIRTLFYIIRFAPFNKYWVCVLTTRIVKKQYSPSPSFRKAFAMKQDKDKRNKQKMRNKKYSNVEWRRSRGREEGYWMDGWLKKYQQSSGYWRWLNFIQSRENAYFCRFLIPLVMNKWYGIQYKSRDNEVPLDKMNRCIFYFLFCRCIKFFAIVVHWCCSFSFPLIQSSLPFFDLHILKRIF